MGKKKAKDYEFNIHTSGKGVMDAGVYLGRVSVKSKSSEVDTLMDKAYEQLESSIPTQRGHQGNTIGGARDKVLILVEKEKK
tara:strand:+ start:3005 stop:3250 length:246 start_codon:yes stop_codon:yes gene_type:complete